MVKQKARKPWARALAGFLSAAMVITMAPDMALNVQAAAGAYTGSADLTVTDVDGGLVAGVYNAGTDASTLGAAAAWTSGTAVAVANGAYAFVAFDDEAADDAVVYDGSTYYTSTAFEAISEKTVLGLAADTTTVDVLDASIRTGSSNISSVPAVAVTDSVSTIGIGAITKYSDATDVKAVNVTGLDAVVPDAGDTFVGIKLTLTSDGTATPDPITATVADLDREATMSLGSIFGNAINADFVGGATDIALTAEVVYASDMEDYFILNGLAKNDVINLVAASLPAGEKIASGDPYYFAITVDAAEQLPYVYRAGYDFDGWMLASNDYAATYTSDSDANMTVDEAKAGTSYFAKFTKQEATTWTVKYQVFDTDGTTELTAIEPSNATIDYTDDIADSKFAAEDISSVVPTGRTFEEWNETFVSPTVAITATELDSMTYAELLASAAADPGTKTVTLKTKLAPIDYNIIYMGMKAQTYNNTQFTVLGSDDTGAAAKSVLRLDATHPATTKYKLATPAAGNISDGGTFAGWWYSSTSRNADKAADVELDTDTTTYLADRAKLVSTAVNEGGAWNIYVYPKTAEATEAELTINANGGTFAPGCAIGILSSDKKSLTLYDDDGDFDISGVEGYLTRDGYVLQGYATRAVTPSATNQAETIVATHDDASYDIAGDGNTLVAIWLPERSGITFDDDGDAADDETQVIEGVSDGTTLKPAGEAVKLDGYTLYGWVGKNTNTEFDNLNERVFETTAAADAAIKAVNGAKFYAVGGSIKTADIKTIAGAGVDGVEYFTGAAPASNWFTTTYSARLYPVWVANTYTVTYDLGTAPKAAKYYNYNKSSVLYSASTQTITDSYIFNKSNAYATNYSAAKAAGTVYDVRAVYPKLADNIAPGYVFEGWYTDLDDPTSLLTTIDISAVLDTTAADVDYSAGAANITVYAKWTPIEFYVRYASTSTDQRGNTEGTEGDGTSKISINNNFVDISQQQYEGLTPVLYSDGSIKFEALNVLTLSGATAEGWTPYADTGNVGGTVTPGKTYKINPNFINKDVGTAIQWNDAEGTGITYAAGSRYSDGSAANQKYYYIIDVAADETAGTYAITPSGFTNDEWKLIKDKNLVYDQFTNGGTFKFPQVDGTATGNFYRKGYTFMGWTLTQTDGKVQIVNAATVLAGDANVAINCTTNVTLKPVYAEDVYYVAYAKNSAYKTDDDSTRTAVVPSTAIATGTLGDIPYDEFATENLNFKGWYLESDSSKVYPADTDVSKLAAAMTKAEYSWIVVDGDPTGEVEVEDAATAYGGSRWNWLFPQYDYTYMVIYASADGTSSNPAVELTENTADLPDDLFVEDGKKATGWTLYKDTTAGKTYTLGQATAPYTWLKTAASSAGLTADETHTITATLRVNVADAYTVNIQNGTEPLMTLTFTSAEMGAGNLRDAIIARVKKEIKALGDDKMLAAFEADEATADMTGAAKDWMIDLGWFAPAEEGKHFDGNVKYGNVAAAVKWGNLTLNTLRSAADATTRVVNVSVQMSANTYTVYYALKNTATYGSVQNYYPLIGELIADGAKTLSATYGKSTNNSFTVGASATTANYKFGTFKQWQIVNLYPKTNKDTGNPYVIDTTNEDTYTTSVEGTLADGAAIEDLTAVQGGVVVLYAQYDPKKFTINFSNGQANLKNTTVAGSMSSVTIAATDENLSKDIAINRFSAPGYTFNSWSKATSAVSADYVQGVNDYHDVIVGANYADTITLTAKWAPEVYNITYHMEGGAVPGAAPATYTVEAQKAIPKASDLANYKFDGWFKDPAFKTALDSSSTGYYIPAGSTGDLDLYAKWVPGAITIKFAANGGTGTMADVAAKYNADVTLPANAFTKENYSFYGWSDGTNLYADKATAAFTTKTVTLTAQWANKDSKFVITLNTDSKIPFKEAPKGFTLSGDSKATYTYTYGDTLNLPKAATTNAQYTFKGWADAATGEIIKSVKKTTGGAMNLNAVWAGKKYTVTYDANAPKNVKKVSGKTEKTTVEYGSDWAPANCGTTVTGYEFKGWAKTATATTPDYSFQVSATGKNPFNYEKWEATENLKLYAVWGATASYVTFITVLDGATIDQTGYNVMAPTAWFGADDVQNLVYADPDGTGVAQTIYDKTIMSASAYKYDASAAGSSIELPKAVNGVTATFKGWFAAKKDAGGYYTATPTGKKITSIKPGDEGVYVAKWEGNYEIRYHSGADEKVVTMTNKIGKKVKLTAIDKNWYDKKTQVFVGWSTVEGGAIKYKDKAKVKYAASDLTVATTADKTLYVDLYANYAEKNATYNVLYLDSNGNVAKEATYKYKKGISAKALKKVGKAIAKDDGITYGGFATTLDSAWITDKVVTKIAKKTPGDLILQIVPKGGKTVSVTFNNNASTIGVKVKGKVAKKTVKATTKYISGVNKYKANGYTLVGYSLTPAAGLAGLDFVLTPKKVLRAEDVFAAVSDASVTLYAVWADSDLLDGVDTHYHYYAANTADEINFTAYNTKTATDYPALAESIVTTKNAADPTNGTMFYQVFYSDLQTELPRPSRLGYNFAGWEELQSNGSWKATSSTASKNVIRYFRATWTKVQ